MKLAIREMLVQINIRSNQHESNGIKPHVINRLLLTIAGARKMLDAEGFVVPTQAISDLLDPAVAEATVVLPFNCQISDAQGNLAQLRTVGLHSNVQKQWLQVCQDCCSKPTPESVEKMHDVSFACLNGKKQGAKIERWGQDAARRAVVAIVGALLAQGNADFFHVDVRDVINIVKSLCDDDKVACNEMNDLANLVETILKVCKLRTSAELVQSKLTEHPGESFGFGEPVQQSVLQCTAAIDEAERQLKK